MTVEAHAKETTRADQRAAAAVAAPKARPTNMKQLAQLGGPDVPSLPVDCQLLADKFEALDVALCYAHNVALRSVTKLTAVVQLKTHKDLTRFDLEQMITIAPDMLRVEVVQVRRFERPELVLYNCFPEGTPRDTQAKMLRSRLNTFKINLVRLLKIEGAAEISKLMGTPVDPTVCPANQLLRGVSLRHIKATALPTINAAAPARGIDLLQAPRGPAAAAAASAGAGAGAAAPATAPPAGVAVKLSLLERIRLKERQKKEEVLLAPTPALRNERSNLQYLEQDVIFFIFGRKPRGRKQTAYAMRDLTIELQRTYVKPSPLFLSPPVSSCLCWATFLGRYQLLTRPTNPCRSVSYTRMIADKLLRLLCVEVAALCTTQGASAPWCSLELVKHVDKAVGTIEYFRVTQDYDMAALKAHVACRLAALR